MNFLFFEKITNNAKIPYKLKLNSAGYQIFSAYDYVIKKNCKEIIKTDLKITLPNNYYARIELNPELLLKSSLNIISRIIDQDSKENICVVIINHHDNDYIIERGDCIGLLVLEKIKKDIESFEILGSLNSIEPIKVIKTPIEIEIQNSEGHDVIDRLGCQIENCQKCAN
jgi:dUTP pyrophosphatase